MHNVVNWFYMSTYARETWSMSGNEKQRIQTYDTNASLRANDHRLRDQKYNEDKRAELYTFSVNDKIEYMKQCA